MINMQESLRKKLKLQRNLKKEIKEIEDIIKTDEDDSVKLDSIRAILNELGEEIVEERIKAIIDDVTGCVTHRFLTEFLTKEIEETKRYKKKLVIISVDLDFLKYINDNFGHVIGTHVIEKIAEILKKNARESDLVSRIGGDEFLLVCPNTTERGATILVNRIKKDVLEYKFDKGIKTSVSVGIKGFKEEYSTVKHFLHEVDKELYKAKKNRVNLNLKK